MNKKLEKLLVDLGSCNSDEHWIDWDCPDCEETHSDPEFTNTHCRKCGLSVTVYETPQSHGWHVKLQI